MRDSDPTVVEIRAQLGRQDRTLTWLANHADIDRQALSRKMNGHSEFTVAQVRRIALALNIEPALLMPSAA